MPRRLLLSRGSAVLAALVTMVIFLGCMTATHEEMVRHSSELPVSAEPPTTYLPGDGILVQTGTGSISGEDGVLDVYYPVPYISPPNLSVSSSFHDAVVIDQKRDHFRVRNRDNGTCSFHWEAKGIKMLLNAPAAVAESPSNQISAGGLPAEPVPISRP